MKKRLGIFCFFDKAGIVDSYVGCLLKDIGQVLEKLIIVVNGKLNENGKRFLKQFTDTLIIRDNVGYDGGAYADVCVNYLGQAGVSEWDEIILINDTFFGPFVPFQKIFAVMEDKICDFWGLNYINNGFLSYVESYFLVFRKEIVKSNVLHSYFNFLWKFIEKDSSYAYYAFELGIFNYLLDRNYTYKTYTNTQNYSIYYNGDVCIEKYKLPFLKKKSFQKDIFCYERQAALLNYISRETEYDINLILQSVNRVHECNLKYVDICKADWKKNKIIPEKTIVSGDAVTRKKILDFLNTEEKIYIYGAGFYAKVIWYAYCNFINKFGGFVISDSELFNNEASCCELPVFKYSEIEEESRMILGLNYNHTVAVLENIKNRKHVLILWNLIDRKGNNVMCRQEE